MRNEILHGYLIHYRKYREKSYIIQFFSEEYGRIDGILRQMPPPQYQPIRIQATGKGELKNFTHLELLNQPIFFHGDAFFVGFYLNEIVQRLCSLEEQMPFSFLQYQITLQYLQQLETHMQDPLFLRQILRQFEYVLLKELGYSIDFNLDSKQQTIEPLLYYHFQSTEGFVLCTKKDSTALSGELICSMQDYVEGTDFSYQQLQLLGKLYRQMLTSLLGDRPLKSRQLWLQSNTQS